jgi:hypothetical protein
MRDALYRQLISKNTFCQNHLEEIKDVLEECYTRLFNHAVIQVNWIVQEWIERSEAGRQWLSYLEKFRYKHFG